MGTSTAIVTAVQSGGGSSPSPDFGASAFASLGSLCWPDLTFDRERVMELGVPAECWTTDGDYWEYDGEVFYLTRSRERIRHEPVAELSQVTDGPWSHAPDCACAACRVAISAVAV